MTTARYFATVGLIALATPAFADDTTVSIEMSAAVAPRCQIKNPVSILDFGEISRSSAASLSISFFCNTNFRFIFSSLKGGLVHTSALVVSPPFVSQVPYRMGYKIGTSRGTLVDTCLSGNMIGLSSSCRGASDPNAVALDETISLEFSWTSMGQHPIAGKYQDTLQLRIGPTL
jgi:hypothetical protein